MQAKHILSALLSFMIPITSFAVDSTGVPVVTSSPAKGDSYTLGIGTFLGLYNSPGGPWTELTQNYQASSGTPTIDWKSMQTKNMCDSGFYPVVTYSLMKGNTGGTNDTSVAIVADLCFRISSDNKIQIFPINLLNKRPPGYNDRYAAINFTITCVRCTNNCSNTYIVFPQPYNNASKPVPYDCASIK